jgi:hypothetical protein
MVVDVGALAAEFGNRPIASHRPFVGSQFTGTLSVGKTLAGLDAEETGARWLATEAATDTGRARIVDGTRTWAMAARSTRTRSSAGATAAARRSGARPSG